ncbi:MAG TPA: DNA ligase D [Solirubrobacteraceae bacterium]|nr:DNA ligase D [Solirubrobacteraceae bacterium]
MTPRRLADYDRKRRFDETPEPTGDGASADGDGARFVVHEHHARRLHWDLRLEHEGALASWAIPNGIPDDPRHNRKAVHVEDHPLDYIDFEGSIPEGNYGAGTVKVWDRGTYTLEKWQPKKVIVVFHGERLRGRYALFQAGSDEKDWLIHRMDPPLDPTADEMPELVAPMLAQLSEMPADESQWAFEVKWDGVRALARSEPGRLRLLTRNGNDVTAAYPELRVLNRALSSHSAIVDGEIVAFDEHGKPSFQALQSRIHLRGGTAVRRAVEATPATYVAFDLLWLDGHPLLELPYEQRRELLAALELGGDRVLVPEYHVGDGVALLQATREQGLEGIVAKRLGSRYAPGKRSAAWLKIKNAQRQELVIGGWSDGKGGRSGRIGALDLGVHDEDGELRYAGRVGTGFDAAELDRLAKLLEPLARDETPFSGRQPPRGAHFAEPELVCEVEFGEWTKQGLLRHPVYRGLRDDKPAAEVVRERVAPPPKAEKPAAPKPKPKPVAKRRAKPAPGAAIDELIAAGRPARGGVEVDIDGRTLKLTNLDKVLYPATGFTKGDLIAYYAAVAPVLLPHLHDRPLTLKRYPDGVDGKFFYEKQAPRHRPEWVQTKPIWSRHSNRSIDYCLCQDLPTLVWLANLAAIELHPSLSKADEIERPTTLAFDLDPGPPATVVECCAVAIELRDLFDQLGLRAFAKTSGSKGLQVYVPLNAAAVRYDDTKPLARVVAELFEQRHPQLVVAGMAKADRTGKVLIDWSQNDEHKTTICVYSTRARERATVSAPVTWEEVVACRDAADPALLTFDTADVLTRVSERGDAFSDVLTVCQQLPDLT